MRMWKGYIRWRVILSLTVPATLMGIAEGAATMSEIDSYQLAVTSQSKESALAFINEFSSSHLIGDLIESLQPGVAREVCASLPSGPASLRGACQRLSVISATLPVASQRAQTTRSSASDVGSGLADVSADSSTADPEMTDVDIAPAAGPQSSTGELANTASRHAEPTGKTSALAVPIPPPSLEDDVEQTASDEEGDDGLGDDVVTSKQSDKPPEPAKPKGPPVQYGKDPGSESGSNSGGGKGDSHH